MNHTIHYAWPDSKDAGVEEVTCIATLQHLLGQTRAVAKVVRVPGLAWHTSFMDEERRKWHERKMASKVSRPAAQMELLGLPSGVVLHLEADVGQ